MAKQLKVQYYTGRVLTDDNKAKLKHLVSVLEVKEVQIDLLLKMLKESIN